MFWIRLRSSIILMAAALLTIISGGTVLFGTLLAVSLIGLGELYRAVGVQTKEHRMLALVGYLAGGIYYVLLWLKLDSYSMMYLVFTLIVMLAVYVFAFPKYKSEQVMAAFFGIVYVCVMLGCVYQTRSMTDGAFLVWLIFISSWGCDTCAYCVGMLIGKHKMSPVLSPKKSVEGAVGGVAGATLIGAVYAAAVGKYLQSGDQVLNFAVICAAGALISMVGDLAASAIKRNHEIKDYGTLIPGHGGILDRFDSVIFTAPVIYYLAAILIGSTGSIGTQTLEVARANGDLKIAALAAGRNIKMLEAQIREFLPRVAAVWEEGAAKELRTAVADLDVKIVSGMDGLLEICTLPEVEIVVTAIVGMIGIRPTIAAIEAGKDIALANKETLVTAAHYHALGR